MTRARPFGDEAALYAAADRIWSALKREDWLEAFSHHPRIGEKQLRGEIRRYGGLGHARTARRRKGPPRKPWLRSRAAIRITSDASDTSFWFAPPASRQRRRCSPYSKSVIHNSPNDEIQVAAAEQAKITRIRLEKWLTIAHEHPRSPITTHVLDISRGKAAAGVAVTLERQLSSHRMASSSSSPRPTPMAASRI